MKISNYKTLRGLPWPSSGKDSALSLPTAQGTKIPGNRLIGGAQKNKNKPLRNKQF